MQKETYYRLLGERLDEMQKISKEIDYNKLIYYFKGSSTAISYTQYNDPLYIYDKTKKWWRIIKKQQKKNK